MAHPNNNVVMQYRIENDIGMILEEVYVMLG